MRLGPCIVANPGMYILYPFFSFNIFTFKDQIRWHSAKQVILRAENHPFLRHLLQNNSELFSFTQGCLPLSRWDQLNAFFNESKSLVIFGLNAFMEEQPPVWWFCIGRLRILQMPRNELCGSGVGIRFQQIQYASDTMVLKNISIAATSNGRFFDPSWFKEFIDKTNSSLDAGVDEHLVQKILDPSYLDGEADTFNNLESIIKSYGSTTDSWVGEAGGT
ncbi:hypothetical protein Leryth_026949 [Lithospermum erythrorhizon]|nr:hypothetical protein Leryth_026949 [Lithospermum erythrorhizon]